MTLIFSALESDLYEAENLIHVTTMQLSNDLSHMHHNCHMLPSVAMAIFLQLILLDCQMLFWVAHEEIIMTLKSTDIDKIPYWDKKHSLFSATCSALHTGLAANWLNEVP